MSFEVGMQGAVFLNVRFVEAAADAEKTALRSLRSPG
jgi:hypothetical protein